MDKICRTCDEYRPQCRLYGYYVNGKPHVDRVVTCENHGCEECKKGEE